MSLPKRNTTNPALGVLRCGCGDVKTVHMAKGNRKGALYTICDQCGTDQRNGAPVQAKWATHFESVEALEAHEAEGVAVEAAPAVVSAPVIEPEPKPEPVALATPKAVPPPAADDTPSSVWPILRGILLGAVFGGLAARF
ncbi:hypothetical protein [Enterovibrio paralichthyis]|uniref:hypothetical protein n=1 Tax=Enterovibrio paralichthyis TaxID=2853805 RepID=UPI001C46E096|nr:hypothetical protein [Enterovibrio paralichthyis]MBV7296830.1 hypothetical protein [Enterovibrio paralichthyis]